MGAYSPHDGREYASLSSEMSPRVRQPTTRLLSEWLLDNYPQGGYRLNVPLGPAPEGILQAFPDGRGLGAARPFRPKADAVLFLPQRLALIEAKDMKWREGIGQLHVYKGLVPRTPELAPFAGRAVELWLLTPWENPVARAAAEELGVRMIVWTPAWIRARVEDLNDYWTRDHRERRERRRNVLRQMGME